MEWLSDIFIVQFAVALASIIAIDLTFTGGNAILITLAAYNLPPELQKKAIMWGAAGAIAVRALMTLAVVRLLKIPSLMLVGGLTLVWIAWKLLADDGQGGDEHGADSTTLMDAMKTITIADAVMGTDNAFAIAGVSHSSFPLVVLGPLVSTSAVVWGSGVALRLTEYSSIIIYGDAVVLAYTATHMVVVESVLKALFAAQPPLKWAVYVAVLLIVLGGGWPVQRRCQQPV